MKTAKNAMLRGLGVQKIHSYTHTLSTHKTLTQ